jgi:hypothetical protein
MLSNTHANTKSSEAVFLGGLSSEQPLRRNPCALSLYILILSWQDVWVDSGDSKFASVRTFILVWQPFRSIRKEEIMLAWLRIRHNCLTVAMCPHVCFYTVWCAHYHLAHLKVVAIIWQIPKYVKNN